MSESNTNTVKRLPSVEKVKGLSLVGEEAKLQYEANGQIYEIAFPLFEILQAEEYFIQLRRDIGAIASRR